MPDVIDFLVLRQFYDEARQRNWQSCKFILLSFMEFDQSTLFISLLSVTVLF
jgi:hypothetical protein